MVESIGILGKLGNFLRKRQRWVLLGMLAVLHLTLLAGNTTIGLMLWFVGVGLFILWQPFFQTERQLDYGDLAIIILVLAAGGWLFGWWLLIVWVIVLASLLGGRVMRISRRSLRIPYLMAFAYLIGAVLIWLVPKVVPDPALVGPSLEKEFSWAAPLLFMGMVIMPRLREEEKSLTGRGIVDFFYSLFIFLLISVLVLGSLAFTLLQKSLYFEALSRTAICTAVLLFLIAWLWNPRSRFSGLGVLFSQYMMSISLPFDTWLRLLMECSEKESDPDQFMQMVCERLLAFDSPWVVGGGWSPLPGAEAGSGHLGEVSQYKQMFRHHPLILTVYTRQPLSPVLIMHFQLLAQQANEYYLAKWRARELQRMSYLRAVHETGARLTHDVKNLLQSLDSLCYMMQSSEGGDTEALHQLLRRQLPQIGQRLQQTLSKLQEPQGSNPAAVLSPGEEMPAIVWWEGLQQRFSQNGVCFEPVEFNEQVSVHAVLFDSVADNSLHNAITKRQSENDIQIRVSITPDARMLRVCDSGSPVRRDVLVSLLQAPVASENGLGIGLYHAARQAESMGYSFRLASNVQGRVCFELAWMPI